MYPAPRWFAFRTTMAMDPRLLPIGADDDLDALVFHGDVRRAAENLVGYRYGWHGEGHPLLITRSGRFIPSVIAPSFHLVAVAEVARALAGFGMIDLLAVKFDRLVDLPDIRGDRTRLDSTLHAAGCDESDSEYLLERLPLYTPTNPPQYFEILPPTIYDFELQAGTPRIRVRISAFGDSRELTLPASLAKSCQLVCATPFWFATDRMMDVLGPELDDSAFLVTPAEVTVDI